MEPIGIIRSPFREKFAVPRQGGLAPAAIARLELLAPYDDDAAVEGLRAFSHLWVIFVFHQHLGQGWHATVRPPRLGGNARVGVFASRSSFRPNPLGLSVVELRGIRRERGRLSLELGAIDMVDGTPVLDIKPYVAYADSIPQAACGFAESPPEARLAVTFSADATAAVAERAETYPQLAQLIEQVLQADPRPAYRRDRADEAQRRYGARLLDFDLRWRVVGEQIVVEALEPLG